MVTVLGKAKWGHRTFPARCLLQESDGGNKYKTFLFNLNQWAWRLGMEQVSVAEHTSCLPMGAAQAEY